MPANRSQTPMLGQPEIIQSEVENLFFRTKHSVADKEHSRDSDKSSRSSCHSHSHSHSGSSGVRVSGGGEISVRIVDGSPEGGPMTGLDHFDDMLLTDSSETSDEGLAETQPMRKASRKHRREEKKRMRGAKTSSEHWLVQWLNRHDKKASNYVHQMSLGPLEYLFVPGAFVFGSRFMFVTILFLIVLVKISGFLFTGTCCAITVTITELAKKHIGRLRPDPRLISYRRFDFRTRLTNCSFPSGDTAQAAAYGTCLFFLTHHTPYLGLMFMCAWSRIYFGCHFIADCVAGGLVGVVVAIFMWTLVPLSAVSLLEDKIVHFILAIITR